MPGMKRLLPALLVLGVAPLLLAPVRLRDSTPGFFTPPGQSPAPESYSLPAAEPLITPTVIFVSPTVETPAEVTPTAPSPTIVSSTLNLLLPPSPTTPPPAPKPAAPVVSNRMTDTSAALCARGMLLVRDLTMMSYEESQKRAVLTLSLAAAMTLPEVSTQQWPNLAAYNKAVAKMPWFYPHKAEIQDASEAATALCRRPY